MVAESSPTRLINVDENFSSDITILSMSTTPEVAESRWKEIGEEDTNQQSFTVTSPPSDWMSESVSSAGGREKERWLSVRIGAWPPSGLFTILPSFQTSITLFDDDDSTLVRFAGGSNTPFRNDDSTIAIVHGCKKTTVQLPSPHPATSFPVSQL
ncbi:hypothetical protein BLNAU_24627 [Blattamonas nauphoetae]|uniref:Uncharacterized protein n=1 Tax=Blattamonas nauphoetae TaxID=2049346 RepID=A0ABQ9WLV7_9EUKA|nr:hypothetical protein BLNAU_24627 [Blattamonas nauphoetae]